MTKKQILIFIGFVIILISIPVTMYLVRQTQIFAPKAVFIPKIEFLDAAGQVITETTNPNVKLKITKEAAPSPSPSDTIDTLDYFLTDHPEQGLTGTHPFSQTVEGQIVYLVKWDEKAFERFRWDDQFIYLEEDHSSAPVDIYSFSEGKWMRRQMKIGEKLTVLDNTIKVFDQSCQEIKERSGPFPIEMTLESHIADFDVGGDLNKQDVIVLKYDSSLSDPSGIFEKFYYSKEWGLILWQEYTKENPQSVRNESKFNLITTKIQPDKSVACTTPS